MTTLTLAAASTLLLSAAALAQPHHHAEMMLDHHLATNRIHVHTHGGTMPYVLPASAFPGINGWAAAEVAFTSAETDHPALGTVVLPATVDLRAVLLSASPGMHVYGGLNPLAIGGELVLGAPVVHFMPIWNISAAAPGEVKSITFMFRDASGQVADSEPFTATFTVVPAPASFLVGLAGACMIGRRRQASGTRR